ncbi:MAG: sigma-54-dependent Fis family transcriptional regulator [Rhizobiales bacterium]|nr:sigma-54-dependent Fis family transcriptional regulator [Hyphomicrobiales bacterium]
MSDPHIILVDDDDDLRAAFVQGLELEGFTVSAFADAESALRLIKFDDYAVVISDIRMPGMDGMAFLKQVNEIDIAIPVILVTGHADIALAVEAMRNGCYDFIEKPFAVSTLAEICARALEKRRLVLENRALRDELSRTRDADLSERYVGISQAAGRVRREILTYAATDAPVLVHGPEGSGKALVSRLIHEFSPRRDQPFINLDCATTASCLIETELFGKVRRDDRSVDGLDGKLGLIADGEGATVVLRNFQRAEPDLVKRVFAFSQTRYMTDEGQGRRRGPRLTILWQTGNVKDSDGGQDGDPASLAVSFAGARMRIPALSERREDVPFLFFQLARQSRARYRREIPNFEPDLIQVLKNRDWPDNVRGLRDIAERWVLGLENSVVHVRRQKERSDLASRVAAFERALIEEELTRHGGKLKDTYEVLGLSRKGLYDKMRKHGLLDERSD